MGRNKKTAAQRRAERFEVLYRTGKARLGLLEPDIAAMIGVSKPTLLSYRQDPGKLPLDKAAILWTAMGWTNEEIASVLFPDQASPSSDSARRSREGR